MNIDVNDCEKMISVFPKIRYWISDTDKILADRMRVLIRYAKTNTSIDKLS